MKKLLPSLIITGLFLSPLYGMEKKTATAACFTKKESLFDSSLKKLYPKLPSLETISEDDEGYESRKTSPNTTLESIQEEEEDTSNC